jgi:tetratricopeptide (TPR) repeat protein
MASDEQRSIAECDIAGDALRNQRLREAFDHVQQALKLNSENAEAAYLGVVVLLAFCALDGTSPDCRLKEAEAMARKTLEVAPEHRDAKNALGVILIHEQRYDEAIAVLKPLTEDLIFASPENAWGNLGWAYFLRGNVNEAIVALRRAVAVQPLFCVGHYRLGLAYEKKGELALAQDALTKAVDTNRPECHRMQDAYGARAQVLSRQGHRDEARADLERCRDMGVQTPAGQRCLSQLQTYQ